MGLVQTQTRGRDSHAQLPQGTPICKGCPKELQEGGVAVARPLSPSQESLHPWPRMCACKALEISILIKVTLEEHEQ